MAVKSCFIINNRGLEFRLNVFFFSILPFIYLFIYLFTDLFTERACPQLAKANLGVPCLNKQITKKKYIQTKIN